MLYDCFMFFNEIDLLEMRLNILAPIVDRFVIVEATTTQMGEKRELLFPKYNICFKEFEEKIIYVVCDTDGMHFDSQWTREHYQKNYVINGLLDAKNDDVVLFSDLDEIPNPEKVDYFYKHFDDRLIYHFAQRMFNFFLNYENIKNPLLAACGDFDEVEKKQWLGTKMCSVEKAREISMDGLRQPERLKEPGVRIENGGWHFSYMGGYKSSVEKRVRVKLKSFSHSEYDRWRYYNRLHIRKAIKEGKDFLGREAVFSKVELDESFPAWIRGNRKKYKHLILK